jgi:2-polyprenyl-6-methoxyphenol hydroxylase-like FAD-dependent oxidoreductase
MSCVERVLVVGGGTSGMALAICLRQAGIAADIVEINSAWGTYGAGISLTGPALRALNRLGVLERVAREGFCSDISRFCNASGKPLFATPAARSLGPDIPNSGAILRPVLHAILSDATLACGTNVRLGLTVNDLRSGARGVDVTFSDGTRVNYDLVVGADGIGSPVRTMIFPDAPTPTFTGQGCWRADAPRPPEIDGPHLFLGGPVKAGVNPVSQSEMYMFVLQHVPDNPRMRDTDLHEPLAALLAGFDGPIGAVRDGLGPGSRVVYRPLEKLLLAPPWYAGRIVLIGDAAHATTPHLASGAGIGLEDAIVLAELLIESTSVEQALPRFMTRRFERCRLVVENSAQIGELEMQAAPIEQQAALSRQSAEALALPY